MTILKSFTIAATAVLLMAPASGARAQYGPPQGAPPAGYGQGGWTIPPRAYRQYARQGYLDGIEGARRDVENHRRPNVNNRDEFRRPNVPGPFHRDYRMGFRHGYNVSIQHLLSGRR